MNENNLLHDMKMMFKYWIKILCIYLLGQSNKKIDFMIIGAQKCGTTALSAYMNKHPFCTGSNNKEPLLFTKYYKEKLGLKRIVEYYCFNKFLKNRGNCLFFEATPDYIYEEEVPARIYRYNPQIKMIFLVREPVSRAISEYNMGCRYAIEKNLCVREDPDREYFDCLKQPDRYPFRWFVEEEFRKMKETGSRLPSAFHYPDMIRHGFYNEQLERYYQYFNPDQFLILDSKDLKEKKRETLSAIEDFLEIPHYDWPENELENSNIGVYTQQVPAEYKQFLKEYFKPWNEKFFELIGKRMDWQ